MKIYLTLPYDPDGIEEVETTEDPKDDSRLAFIKNGTYYTSQWWYREGVTWHRTEEAALNAARKFREDWIKETTAEAARIANFPSIIERGAPGR